MDTRTLQPGDLFFALRGERHDGHEFLEDAFRRGAVAAVVDRPVEAPGPLLRVEEVLKALQSLAAWARRQWGGQLIAITGSAGKTTTKEIAAALLAAVKRTAKSEGNLNNHIGVPLSLLRLPDDTEVAVVEMGMNHAGEIRRLAAIARPDVGLVTNIGSAHLGFFHSVEEVALAKRELIESLPAGGVAVLNADDPRVIGFRQIHPGPVLTFGLADGADLRATEVECRPGRIRFRLEGGPQFEAPLDGLHGVSNLLAGLAAARAVGVDPAELAETARQLEAPVGRGRRFVHNGITILDDCYNSNPEAAKRMLEVLRDEPARRRIAVLGEMLELGRWSESLHRDVGRHAARCGIHMLIGIRGAASHMVDEAVSAGVSSGAAFFFEDPAEAGDLLRTEARAGDAVLFKGSRGVHVEIALQRFLQGSQAAPPARYEWAQRPSGKGPE
ncbi:MAG: UDP-N-acetylmuramoyl-tripeptide--D-alanyl-D-alanine ligase [Bryobacteraceae bacterium]